MKMNNTDRFWLLFERVRKENANTTVDDLKALLKAQRTLHRWAEQECGDSNDFASWSIERDETTGKPYRCVYPHKGETRRTPIADREKAALKRVTAICKRVSLSFYHQTDPRGCALYVNKEQLTASDYTHGIAVCL